MVRKKSLSLILFLILFGGITPGFSQTQATNLKAKRQKLEKEISYTNKLLGEVNKRKKILFTNYSLSATASTCATG